MKHFAVIITHLSPQSSSDPASDIRVLAGPVSKKEAKRFLDGWMDKYEITKYQSATVLKDIG